MEAETRLACHEANLIHDEKEKRLLQLRRPCTPARKMFAKLSSVAIVQKPQSDEWFWIPLESLVHWLLAQQHASFAVTVWRGIAWNG